MTRYLWQYSINQIGYECCNKGTIIYENKSYYFCKVCGTDELFKTSKTMVDQHNSDYFTSRQSDKDKAVAFDESRRLQKEVDYNTRAFNKQVQSMLTTISRYRSMMDINQKALDTANESLQQLLNTRAKEII